jgi:hypothetical protein
MPTSAVEVNEAAVEAGRKALREGGFGREIVEAAQPLIEDSCRKRFEEKLLGDEAITKIMRVLREQGKWSPCGEPAVDADLADIRDAVAAGLHLLQAIREGGSNAE